MSMEPLDFNSIYHRSIECSNCNTLCTVSSNVEDKTTPRKKRTVRILGILRYYSSQSKKYIKQCCFIKYYLGHYNQSFVQYLLQVRPLKNERYLQYGDTCIPIFEFTYHELEKLQKDPFSYPDVDNKLEIHRNIKIYAIQGDYKILTPMMAEKKSRSIKMDIDSCSLRDNMIQKIIHYIYIIKDRTAMELGSNIYKIGKTKQENLKRFRGYPKGYKIVLLIACSNCDIIESHIIQLFKKKYIPIKEYGNEYFQGNIQDMIRDIMECII